MHLAHSVRGPESGAVDQVVVLLHAFPLSSAIFEPLMAELAEVAPTVRTIAVDLPGLGGSTWAGPPTVAAMAAMVTDLVEPLLAASPGAGRATVLGISTGGYVALEMAAARPDLVAGLVLSSTTTRVTAPDAPEDRLETAAQLERTGTLEAVLGSADEGLGETAHREQPALRAELLRIIDKADPRGVAWVARALAARRDTSEVLAGFDEPVLLLSGAEDTATPPARAQEMAALRRHLEPGRTRRAILPATGHLTVLERPRRVAQLLADFLDQPVP